MKKLIFSCLLLVSLAACSKNETLTDDKSKLIYVRIESVNVDGGITLSPVTVLKIK